MIAPKLNLDLMIPSLFGVKFKVLHGELNLIDLKTRCVCVWKGGGWINLPYFFSFYVPVFIQINPYMVSNETCPSYIPF